MFSATGCGEITDGGCTVVTGVWGSHVQTVLHGGGLSCEVVAPQEYQLRMLEKLMWASVFWVMSAALGGAKVGRGFIRCVYCTSVTLPLLSVAFLEGF